MNRLIVIGWVATLIGSGCSSPVLREQAGMMGKEDGFVAMQQESPALTGSLFRSDQAVLDDVTVNRILSSKVALPEHPRIALMKFQGAEHGALRYYGYQYWRCEDYLKTQQQYIDTISKKLTGSGGADQVIVLPSLLTPTDATIPVLREAAVRLQAPLLLVFRLTSDIYHKPKLFAQDDVKAYCTCEAVLLDVRTGLIPFTTVITKDRIEKKQKEDLEVSETMRRAETGAVLDSLDTVCNNLIAFLTNERG